MAYLHHQQGFVGPLQFWCFMDTMRHLGFKLSYANPDVWYCDARDCYKYVCIYVDELYVAMKDPNTFMKQLQSNPWNYMLKGVGLPKYHLDRDFFCDSNGTLC